MMSSLTPEISPLTLALGWTIVHTLWQATIVAIGVKILFSLLSNRLSNLRYFIACFALTICIVWAGYIFHQEWQSHQKQEPLIAVEQPEEQEGLQLINGELIHQYILNISYSNQWRNTVKSYIPMIVFFWFCGTLFFIYWLLYGLFRLRQLQRNGLYPTPDEWQIRLIKLCKQMRITKKIQLLLSNRVAGPITFRLFKPVILLPIQLFTGLSTAQIEILLLHELAHIRRFDYAVNLCQSIIEILLFYHPAIWWLNRQIRQEREHCCDDLVLQIQNNPHLYAHVLTNSQVKYSSLKTKLAMAAKPKQSHLVTRIYRLFGKYEYSVLSVKGVFIALLLVTFLLIQEISAQKHIYTNISETEVLTENPQPPILEKPSLLLAEHSPNSSNSAKEDEPKSIKKEKEGEKENTDGNESKDILPKNSKPGKCYEKVKEEDIYESVTKEYLIYTGNLENAPKDVIKMVLETKPATTKWVKKVVSGEECLSKNPKDCTVWCITDVPAEKEEVMVLKDASQSSQFERKVITTNTLIKKGGSEFIEVVCEKNITKNIVTQVQQALKSKGFNAGNGGNANTQFYEGLIEFQNANDLPTGKLNIQTMQLLGIDY